MYLKSTALIYGLNTTDFKAFSDFINFEIIACVFFKRRNYCSGNGLYLLQNQVGIETWKGFYTK